MKVYIIEEVVRLDNGFDSSIKYVSTNHAVAEQLKSLAEQELYDQHSQRENYDDFSINMQIWDSNDSLQVDDSLYNAVNKFLSDIVRSSYSSLDMGLFHTFNFIDDLQLDDPEDERYLVECTFGQQTDCVDEKHSFKIYINKSTLEITD